eukprot:6232181-Amphidinium_carterae.1
MPTTFSTSEKCIRLQGLMVTQLVHQPPSKLCYSYMLGRLVRMHSNEIKDMASVGVGDIIAIAGMEVESGKW